MNRKNFRNNKLLLDTSFLLPILGFETSPSIMSAFRKLRGYRIFYNDISLLEALWKIMKYIRRDEEVNRVIEGIDAVKNTLEHVPINGEAVANAAKMYRLGHRDLVDNLLYSIALSNDLKLLTVDAELIDFIKKNGFSIKNITVPEEL